ncbi:imm11 family protein [Aquimarina hainanensis]|uniref:Imm11 family protein n=1 Tax=Aquimarina hainanensis TaxID=1578017 RepID=A0ABW5N3H7_9FLAO|nr:DUF1629 domain-containing protein [Aquimarina sp. TRL1]QKX06178.1 hypothetical protein HN014_15090 [Aquimarina sp. TRL1]
MQKLLFPDIKKTPNITLSDKASCYEMIWEDGGHIDQNIYDLSNLEFICEGPPPKKKIDLLISDIGCPLVSERLKDKLQEEKIENIHFYPAQVLNSYNKDHYSNFYALNISKLESCIDTEQSEFKGRIINGKLRGIRRINKLILQPTTSAICRVTFFRRLIVVSDLALTVFNDSSFSGIKLIEPRRWDGFRGEKQ